MNCLKPQHFIQCRMAVPLLELPSTSQASVHTPSFSSSLGTDLEIVLQIVHQECHVVSQAPLDRVSLVGLEVLALHLEGPAVLQLSLHPAHAQEVLEDNIVPAADTSVRLFQRGLDSPPHLRHTPQGFGPAAPPPSPTGQEGNENG